jgi:hypothetical protein
MSTRTMPMRRIRMKKRRRTRMRLRRRRRRWSDANDCVSESDHDADDVRCLLSPQPTDPRTIRA